ncbi:hypothetical protein P3S67_026489 [Capsicum chacoense]
MENEHRKWMYARSFSDRRGLRYEFKQGVKEFLKQANLCCQSDGTIRCPCVDCECKKWLRPEDVKTNLYSKGFMENYYVWTSHGEIEGTVDNSHNHNFVVGESSRDPRLHEMVMDAFGIDNEGENQHVVQLPNEEAQRFFAQLESASQPLCEGMSHSELSVAVRLLSIKSDANISQVGMDSVIGLMNELNPNLDLLDNYYKAKKLVCKLGISYVKIDFCEKGCMLYYKDDADLENCKFCGLSRFKQLASGNKVAIKAMHYLPLIPRLKRLYASMSSAPHMRWHYENKRPSGVLCHPSDGEAWKHFDKMCPDFANELRNV